MLITFTETYNYGVQTHSTSVNDFIELIGHQATQHDIVVGKSFNYDFSVFTIKGVSKIN